MTEDPGLHYYDKHIEEAKLRMAPVFGIDKDEEWPQIKGKYLEMAYDHIIANVSFPFAAEFAMPDREKGGEQIIDVTVLEMMDPDETDELDKYGLVCGVNDGQHQFKVPLSEIVIKQGDPNFNLIEDYCIWYWEVKTPPQNDVD